MKLGCLDAGTGNTGATAGGARSSHPNGVNVAFCDGSVHYVSNAVAAQMWYRMLSYLDGQQVAFPNE